MAAIAGPSSSSPLIEIQTPDRQLDETRQTTRQSAMSSPSKVQWSGKVSKSKYQPLRPQFARHGTSEVAATARDKLDDQAGRGEHDLRMLVGHANTLDYLVDRLAAREERRREESLEATRLKYEEKRPISRPNSRPGSRERSRSGSLSNIAEEGNTTSTNEPTSPDVAGDKQVGSAALENPSQSSYFDLREDKSSPALSVVALLESESDSDDSDDSDATASDDEFGSDMGGSDGSNDS